ncbi:MlaD family protein [Actinomadura sp. CNU-125]|uniref:MlaD family protein n=1 Tax=Actinomadura sp. CNU-125 TaxID=1904961 RepID=UPI0021CD03B3|nr:MlaD family protein [Actinomadura sp. CNU-125]
MLTLGTRIKNLVFLVVGLYAVAHVGLNYADLGKYIGLADHYVIEAELPEAGGLAENADVTYRGSSVGRVGELQLTPDASSPNSASTTTPRASPSAPRPSSRTARRSASSTSTCARPPRPARTWPPGPSSRAPPPPCPRPSRTC